MDMWMDRQTLEWKIFFQKCVSEVCPRKTKISKFGEPNLWLHGGACGAGVSGLETSWR